MRDAPVCPWFQPNVTSESQSRANSFHGVEYTMNEDTFNLSIRKFLKMVGVNSQREIEQAVAKARAGGAIKGDEKFPASVTLEVTGLKLSVKFDGRIDLE